MQVFKENGNIAGFNILSSGRLTGRENKTPNKNYHLNEKNLCLVKSTLDASKISYAAQEGAFFRLVVLKEVNSGDSYEVALSISEVSYAEHFWSPSGKHLLFSSCDGGVEVYDFNKNERRWIIESNFAACRLIPFEAEFYHDSNKAFIEVEDSQGYRQITTITLDQSDETESRFSTGWLDHYGPVSYGGENFFYLAYRQGDLPSLEARGDEFKEEESIYLYDIKNNDSIHLVDRRMKSGNQLSGPVLSGDQMYAYFEKEGLIYQYPLLD